MKIVVQVSGQGINAHGDGPSGQRSVFSQL
jgi:hypothetical protein